MQHRPVLLAVLLCAISYDAILASGRTLQQELSNSNGCLITISKCESMACATRNIMGVARWVCLRCLGNYEAVVDSSGQDNIVQCVCPRGFFEPASNASSCSRCPLHSFCPGGDRVEAPSSRGPITACGPNLVTRNTGARSQSDCVASRGYAMTTPTAASPCNVGEYAPQFNRLGRCLRCQSGLQEDPGSNLTDGQRGSKRTVCKVPPGRFMSQGLVRICPQGYFRELYRRFEDSLAQRCLPCNTGITTDGPGAGFATMCNQVMQGYGIAPVYNVSGPWSIPLLPQNDTTGLPHATMCGLGFYSVGGYCAECPRGSVTRHLGSQSIEECMVLPGYFLPAGGSISLCSSGTYREGWLLVSDPRAASCTPCGSGISSEARELDVHPLAANTSLVRATSASCFIEAGQGMIADGRNTFAARDCPANTYGAAGRVYGLISAPCKPCPRHMITDGMTRVNSSDVCINPDGFGYGAEGASRCSPGFYASKGSRQPCQACTSGRTTLDLPSAQRTFMDCFVAPGFGVVNSSLNSNNAFLINTTGMPQEQAARLPVLECPKGMYGAGGALGSTCAPCPGGSTTTDTGSTSLSDCAVCEPGFGRANISINNCSICPIGTYQPGPFLQCLQCPNTTFLPPVDGAGDPWISRGVTTFPGATGQESCVPKESQMAPEAGQAFFSNSAAVQSLLNISTIPTLGDCLATCPPAMCCFVQYHVPSQSCRRVALAPVGPDPPGLTLLYKLPPSSMAAASNLRDSRQGAVKAKMLSSGIYARVAIPDETRDTWLLVGTDLDSTAQTFSRAPQSTLWVSCSEAVCKSMCDNSNLCWGFFFNGTAGLFKGGVDAMRVRSFFVLPGDTDLSPFQWQAPSTPPGPGGGVLPLSPSPSPTPSPSPHPSPSPSPPPAVLSLAELVAVMQARAAGAGIPVSPTWSQCAIPLSATQPMPGTYDVDRAMQLLQDAWAVATGVMNLTLVRDGPYYTELQALSVVLAVYVDKDHLHVNQAANMLQRQRQLSAEVLAAELQEGTLASLQQSLDAVILAMAQNSGADQVDAQRVLRDMHAATQAVLSSISLPGSRAQVAAVLAALHADTGSFNAAAAGGLMTQLDAAARSLMVKAATQGVGMSWQQAADLLLTGFTYSRVFSVDNAEGLLPAVSDALRRMLESAAASGLPTTSAEALDVLLSVYARGGSWDVPDAVAELTAQQSVVGRAVTVTGRPTAEVRVGMAALYGRVGYTVAAASQYFDTSVTFFMQMVSGW